MSLSTGSFVLSALLAVPAILFLAWDNFPKREKSMSHGYAQARAAVVFLLVPLGVLGVATVFLGVGGVLRWNGL